MKQFYDEYKKSADAGTDQTGNKRDSECHRIFFFKASFASPALLSSSASTWRRLNDDAFSPCNLTFVGEYDLNQKERKKLLLFTLLVGLFLSPGVTCNCKKLN